MRPLGDEPLPRTIRGECPEPVVPARRFAKMVRDPCARFEPDRLAKLTDAQLQIDALVKAGVHERDIFSDVTSGTKVAVSRSTRSQRAECLFARSRVTV